MDDKCSTLAHCVFLGPNLVWCQFMKRHILSRSSTKVEYQNLVSLIAEITWLRSLLSELQIPLAKPHLVWCNNLNNVLFFENLVLHKRTKQIELDLYFVREKGHLEESRGSPYPLS